MKVYQVVVRKYGFDVTVHRFLWIDTQAANPRLFFFEQKIA